MTAGDEDDIRRKAYELWEKEGRPEGRHDEHWHRARQPGQPPEAGGETASMQRDPSMQGDREPDMQASGSTGADVSATRHTEPAIAAEAPQSPKQKSAAKKAPRKKP